MDKPPCPRLELLWEPTGESLYKTKCTYSIVFPLAKSDIRRFDNDNRDGQGEVRDEWKAVVSWSHCSAESPVRGGKIDTPLRNGLHALWDREAMNVDWPIIVVWGDSWQVVEREDPANF